MHSRGVRVGGDEALPFVDFLFWSFCTESFHLEIHPAGLDTEQNLKFWTCCRPDRLRTWSRLSPRVNKRFTRKRPPTGPGRAGPGLTLPVSSGPGWSVTEHGRFRGI